MGHNMAFQQFKKVRAAGPEDISTKNINLIQDNIASSINQLVGKDNLDKIIIKNVSLQPKIINKVPHLLGRTLQGWTIVRTHGSYPLIYDVQDQNNSPQLFLYLMSATSVSVDLEVF
jgi:hypothetical protein